MTQEEQQNNVEYQQPELPQNYLHLEKTDSNTYQQPEKEDEINEGDYTFDSTSNEATISLCILLGGFLFPVVWITGFLYVSSDNFTAKLLSYISVILFFIFVITILLLTLFTFIAVILLFTFSSLAPTEK